MKNDLGFMATTVKYSLIFFFTSILGSAYANADESLYFLCGPDEDGCSQDTYQYCNCVPYNEKYAKTPYCLDFDALTCKPVAESPDCQPEFVFKDQGSCLAVIFQSHPEPACPLTTGTFCLEQQSAICAPDGQPDSCKHGNL